jgi:hypothetical protein
MSSNESFIVKVQVSFFTSCKKRQVVIYNEDESFFYQGDLSPEVAFLMGRSLKEYFSASLVETKPNHFQLMLGANVPPQKW